MSFSLLPALLLSLAAAVGAQTTAPARADLMRQCAAEWRVQKHSPDQTGAKYQSYMSDCLKRRAALALARPG